MFEQDMGRPTLYFSCLSHGILSSLLSAKLLNMSRTSGRSQEEKTVHKQVCFLPSLVFCVVVLPTGCHCEFGFDFASLPLLS